MKAKLSILLSLSAIACAADSSLTQLAMTTWSIVAMDRDSGDVGVAFASCVPNVHADALAALVPGVGAAVTQAAWILPNRNRVYAALLEGLSAEAIIDRVTTPESDAGLQERQYGVVTLTAGRIHIASFTGSGNDIWAGARHDLDMAVSVQGNTLVGEAVVAESLNAFLSDSDENTLADRLMRGLEAGSAAGGDIRCNRDGIVSTAVTAGILIARAGDPPYAAQTIGMTDQGTDAAPWLAISEQRPLEGPNPIPEVRRRFDEWRGRPLSARRSP